MMALACTYFPPTCAITSAYSFSAPTAMILPSAPGWPAADEDVQPTASRAAPARAAHATMALGRVARLLRRFGMAGFSQVCRCQQSFGVALPVMIMILTFVCNAAGRAAGLQAAGMRGGAWCGRRALERLGCSQRPRVTHGSHASRRDGGRLTGNDDCGYLHPSSGVQISAILGAAARVTTA